MKLIDTPVQEIRYNLHPLNTLGVFQHLVHSGERDPLHAASQAFRGTRATKTGYMSQRT